MKGEGGGGGEAELALPGRVKGPRPHHKRTTCGPLEGTSVHHGWPVRWPSRDLMAKQDKEHRLYRTHQTLYSLIPRVATSYYLKCPIFNQNNYDTQRNRECGPYPGKQGAHGNRPGSAQLLNLLDKDLDATATNMFRELKETRLKNESVRMVTPNNARKGNDRREQAGCWHGEVQDLLVKQSHGGTIGLDWQEEEPGLGR